MVPKIVHILLLQVGNDDFAPCKKVQAQRLIIFWSPPLTKKRNNTLKQVLTIQDCATKPGSRAELAKELYMLSFYLCGMNAVDLYQLKERDIRNGRVDYNRSKTEGKRRDNAFIGIKIVEFQL